MSVPNPTEREKQFDGSKGIDVDLRYFFSWMRHTMPELNEQIRRKEVEPEVLMNQVRRMVANLPPLERYDRRRARLTIQMLGFAVSSVERHAQDRSAAPGTALKEIDPNLESFMMELGKIGGHPPRDTVYTYCTLNDPEELLTFTGDPQEILFIKIVATTFGQVKEAAQRIAEILDNPSAVSDPQSMARLDAATAKIEEMRLEFMKYMVKNPDGTQALTPDFFLNVFRQYNCSFPIGGETWGAPTAANSTDHWLIDFMIGQVDKGYQEHILSRRRYLTEEDVAKIEARVGQPGLVDKLAAEVGFNVDELQTMTDGEFSDLIQQLPEDKSAAVLAVGKFLETYARASATHWTLIHNYIIRPLKVAPKDTLATTVDPERGTSGLTLAEVAQIRDNRLKAALLERYKKVKPKTH